MTPAPLGDSRKEEEKKWEEIVGLKISNVLNHYQVSRTKDGKTILFSAMQRHECRAFIKGYIQGNLDGLNRGLEIVIENT